MHEIAATVTTAAPSELKLTLDNLKIRMPLALMFLSTLPSELDNLGVSADYVEKQL